METKHTKEYAEKLAKENFKQSPDLFMRRSIYVKGYMKAIEETAAPELLEALIDAVRTINMDFPNGNGALIYKCQEAIKKATK